MYELIQRLKDRLKEDLECARNNEATFQTMKPEVDKWDAQQPCNLYVVKLAFDHLTNLRKDRQYASDLEKVIEILSTLQEEAP